MLAVIGGTGLSELANLRITHRQVIRTPYGEPSGALMFGNVRGHDVVFLARHGHGHTIPPHEVNYRANVWALRENGARRIVAVNAVGGIVPALGPGAIAIPDQIIDYTWGRKHTYFETPDQPVTHIDFTHPYDAGLRAKCLQAAEAAGLQVADGGVYAAVQGPRLETAAEIDRMERDGATMVGMTGMPEAALARELGLPYAAIALVANHAAGRGDSASEIKIEAIYRILEEGMVRVRKLIETMVESDGD